MRSQRNISVVTTLAELESLTTDINSFLQQPGVSADIYQTSLWVNHEVRSRGIDASPYVIFLRDRGKIIAMAPLVLHTAPSTSNTNTVLRFSFKSGMVLRYLGSDIASETAERNEYAQQIASFINDHAPADVLILNEVPLTSSLLLALKQGNSLRQFTLHRSSIIDQNTWEIVGSMRWTSYIRTFPGRRRRKLEAHARALERRFKSVTMETYATKTNIQAFKNDVCSIVNESWNRTALAPIWNAKDWMSLLNNLADQDLIRGYVMYVEEKPVAYAFYTLFKGKLVLEHTAYSQDYARHGVGFSLIFKTVEAALEGEQLNCISFGYGNNQYKAVLANTSFRSETFYLARGFWPQARFGLFSTVRAVKSAGYHMARAVSTSLRQKKAPP